MTPTEVTHVNEALSRGDIDAAIAVLADKVDVRAAELPKLEKKTVASLASFLATDAATAQAFAGAFFHPNISVRRLARKLGQTLKDSVAPIGPALVAALDCHVRAANIPPMSFEGTPAQTKLRNEQIELVGNVVEQLLKIDAGGLMGLLSSYAPIWGARQAEYQEKMTRANTAWKAFREVYDRKRQALWDVKLAELGITNEQVPANLEEKWNEELNSDPEVVAARPERSPYESEPLPTSITILEEGTCFRGTFNVPLYQLASKGSPDDPAVRAIGRNLWEWAEKAAGGDKTAIYAIEMFQSLCHPEAGYVYFGRDELVDRMPALLTAAKSTVLVDTHAWFGLLKSFCTALSMRLKDETAAPLPAHITPKLLHDLKTPKLTMDRIIAPVVDELLKRYPDRAAASSEASTPPIVEPPVPKNPILARMLSELDKDENSFDRRWEIVRKKVAAIADSLADVDARAHALIVPPKVTWEKLRGRMIEDDVDRDNLIAQWKTSPSWDADRAALAPVVRPMILESLKAHAVEWYAAKTGKSAVPDHPDPAKWELMDKKERKIWIDNQRYEQKSKHNQEVNELSRMFLAVCGTADCLELLDALPQPEMLPLRVDIENRLLERWEKAGSPQWEAFPPATPQLLPVVREVYARRLSDDHGAEDRLEPPYRIHRYASILYRIGSDDAVAEARALLESGELNLCYSCVFGTLALERLDYEIIVPLAAHTWAGSAEKPLSHLMASLSTHDPERHESTAVALVSQLARVSDKNQPAIHFELLDAIPADSPVFTKHVDAVAEGIESTLPDVVKWAMTRLAGLTAFDADWVSICRRAGDKLWADQPGMVKDAAKFLGTVGADRADCRQTAAEVLADALSLENVALQEAILKAMASIKAKDKAMAVPASDRIRELGDAQPDRFGKLAAKLLA